MSGPRYLTVRHKSTYRYSEPVSFGEHRMMFRPRSSHDMRLMSSQLRITPTPDRLHWLHDVFDNSVAIATFSGEASQLLFDSAVTLEHYAAPLPEYAIEPYAATWPFAYTNEEAADLVNARSRRYPDGTVDSWAHSFIARGGDTSTMAMLRAITTEIKDGFVYVRRAEKGVYRPADTLYRRSGSCRDFAVLMIDAARSLGFAARFVSGYIFVPDYDATQGGGATHAWLQIFLPGAGWVDFDPTNSIIGNQHLIRVAVAWDQHQALPLWGTWTGAQNSFLGLDVEVSVTEDRC
ncbi:transglutaminase family protein [Paraburkholderia panacisoli]|uniref:Transglutaminase family protein n=1 Tax=Paraburkholderia panacisoli TaxID=2603818 RepID=A0A5B0H8G7_9BURK|nr:transglutaminase family protein [Paraburkholderia panacisoli]KAA1011283.1 transglutaminase family protein [Paraburkholderia panacisoli]